MRAFEGVRESSEQVASFEAEVGAWGDLSAVDDYNHETRERYHRLVARMQLHTTESLLAAALVDIDESDTYGMYPSKIISAAINAAEAVRGWQDFTERNPDEVGLSVGQDNVILFQIQELGVQLVGIGRETQRGTHLRFRPPLQTYASVYDGRLNGSVEVSSRDNPGVRGMYKEFIVRFHEIDRGMSSQLTRQITPPLTLGREAITALFEERARQESWTGGTDHRSTSLPYVIWRLRDEDGALAVTLDASVARYGLREIWAEQHRREIGAKAAHVLFGGHLEKGDTSGGSYERLSLRSTPAYDSEYEVFNPSREQLVEATAQQCRRLGVVTQAANLEAALEFVIAER